MPKKESKFDANFKKELKQARERVSIRIALKDVFRDELMTVCSHWSFVNNVNGYELCAKVHDEMNFRIQGLPAKDIKKAWQLLRNQLIRDFLDSYYLRLYCMVNCAAIILIKKGKHPLDAVHQACDDYLPLDHTPTLAAKRINVHLEQVYLYQKRKNHLLSTAGIQLELPLLQEAS